MQTSSNSSTQRTALVTGAAGGIGSATVLKFIEAGWQVIAVDRAEKPDRFTAAVSYI
ncbi:MAG TPA: SDR family NAD(P)-dependent oxidoreductase, partial [Anaerolineales bacterium]|nr:SDR family NAD(P)-dependent oxidoreductase [Anaerolineales bacterium]